MRRTRMRGLTWEQIAEALGVSRQATRTGAWSGANGGEAVPTRPAVGH